MEDVNAGDLLEGWDPSGNGNSSDILMCHCTDWVAFLKLWHQEVLLSFVRMSTSLYFLLALGRCVFKC